MKQIKTQILFLSLVSLLLLSSCGSTKSISDVQKVTTVIQSDVKKIETTVVVETQIIVEGSHDETVVPIIYDPVKKEVNNFRKTVTFGTDTVRVEIKNNELSIVLKRDSYIKSKERSVIINKLRDSVVASHIKDVTVKETVKVKKSWMPWIIMIIIIIVLALIAYIKGTGGTVAGMGSGLIKMIVKLIKGK